MECMECTIACYGVYGVCHGLLWSVWSLPWLVMECMESAIACYGVYGVCHSEGYSAGGLLYLTSGCGSNKGDSDKWSPSGKSDQGPSGQIHYPRCLITNCRFVNNFAHHHYQEKNDRNSRSERVIIIVMLIM